MPEKMHVVLPADTNQALGLAQYALDFMSTTPGKRGEPSPAVLEKTNLFHTDAVIAGISALSLGTNAPNLLRNEALGEYRTGPAGFGSMAGLPWAKSAIRTGVPVFGSSTNVAVEKALVRAELRLDEGHRVGFAEGECHCRDSFWMVVGVRLVSRRVGRVTDPRHQTPIKEGIKKRSPRDPSPRTV